MIPGEYHLQKDDVVCNEGYPSISIKVKNVGDRPVQVGSHFHFYEANECALQFDREKAYGKRLDIIAGTAVRFEPGEERTVNLIDYGGKRRVFGFNNKVDGFLDASRDRKIDDASAFVDLHKQDEQQAKGDKK